MSGVNTVFSFKNDKMELANGSFEDPEEGGSGMDHSEWSSDFILN